MNKIFISLAALALLLAAPPAFAYLDPATGSMILQAILGGVAGLLVAGKLFWHRILAFLGIRKYDTDLSEDHDSNQ